MVWCLKFSTCTSEKSGASVQHLVHLQQIINASKSLLISVCAAVEFFGKVKCKAHQLSGLAEVAARILRPSLMRAADVDEILWVLPLVTP